MFIFFQSYCPGHHNIYISPHAGELMISESLTLRINPFGVKETVYSMSMEQYDWVMDYLKTKGFISGGSSCRRIMTPEDMLDLIREYEKLFLVV